MAREVVAPDRVVWKLTIVANHQDLEKAKQLSDRQLEGVMAATQSLAVAQGDIEVGRVRIEKVHERAKNFDEGKFSHYSLQRAIIVREHDVDRFDEYLDALVVGTDIVAEMKYEVAGIDSITDGLNLVALQNARRKAEDYATAMGAVLGQPILISEYKPDASAREISEDQALSRQTGPGWSTFVVPEKTVIFARVYATFELK
jgi:uncharacterized protein YggE